VAKSNPLSSFSFSTPLIQIKSLHEGHINVSVKTEEGLDALKERVFVMMDTIHTILHEEKPTEDISVS
jgi:hypothetical protein